MSISEAARKVRPLELDPEVMASIHPLVFHDAPASRAHHAAMGDSTWARLGVRFLTTLYRNLVHFTGLHRFRVPRAGSGPRLHAGGTDPDRMMATVFRKAWFLPGARRLPRACDRRPSSCSRHLGTRRSVTGGPAGAGTCGVPVLQFRADLRGKRVAGAINKVLFDDLASRGIGT